MATRELLSSGVYHTLTLPDTVELYRLGVFAQLYSQCPTISFESLCWATPEAGIPPEQQSTVAVFPGEEAFLLKQFELSLSGRRPQAFQCLHGRSDTFIDKRQAALLREQNPALPDSEYPTRTRRLCNLSPTLDRPLLCRLFPMGVRPIRGEPRRAHVVCWDAALRAMQRRGSRAITQMAHDVMQVFVALWAWLDDKWWSFYETSFRTDMHWVSLGTFDFELTSDMVHSFVRGAPPVWREQLLAQIASPTCPVCEGKGIEFWDRVILANGEERVLPVAQRRFDLCRDCVLPALGMLMGGHLVDPHTRKILTPDGKHYRGDKL